MFNLSNSVTFARIVRWGVIALIAYGVIQTFSHPHRPDDIVEVVSPNVTLANPIKQTVASGEQDDEFSLSALPVFSVQPVTVISKDLSQGSGIGAVCGQLAQIRYELKLSNGTSLFSNLTQKDTTPIAIGSNTALRGIEQGIIGMKKGAERVITIPAQLAFFSVSDFKSIVDGKHYKLPASGVAHETVTATIHLVELTPDVPASDFPLRRFEKRRQQKDPLMCGDTATIDLTLWSVAGKKLFSSEKNPIVFRLGGSEVPYGIEQAVIGMSEGNTTTAIIPPAFFPPLIPKDEKKPSAMTGIFKQQKNEMIIAEIRIPRKDTQSDKTVIDTPASVTSPKK